VKVCIVSSGGGHLTEVRALKPAYGQYEHFYVLNDRTTLPDDMERKTYVVTHAERDWRTIFNLWEAFRILRKERPNIIISTGASPVVAFALVGKLFFRTKTIFVETFTRVSKPSLTGRIMYWLADDFYYQWEEQRPVFPKGTYGGLVL